MDSYIHCDVRRAGLFAMLGDYRCYNGSIQQVLDNQYQHELNNFHSDMLHHVSVGPAASHWERCWSSLYVYAFLLTRIQCRSRRLERNMKTVLQPLYAIVDMNRKVFSPSTNDIPLLKEEYVYYRERIAGCMAFGHKIDRWQTFSQKVDNARSVVVRLCLAKVFPVDTDIQLLDAVTLITPYLSQMTRDEFRHIATWLSKENIKKVDSITHLESFDEYEEIASYQRNMVLARRKHPLPLSMTTEIRKRARMRGIMSQEPTLRQQHIIESSRQTSLFSQKASTENSVNVVVTRNRTEDSSVNNFGNKNQDLLFDGSKEGMSRVALPTIVIETYRDKSSNKLVSGPPKCEQGHPSCFSNDRNYRLSMVLSCPTTSAYIYCFSMAHTRPHFVISGKDMPSYLSKAMSAKCGMPKLILHSKPCLSSPIKVNNDDGSINFYLYSSSTKEFGETFDSVNTDFYWWMKKFDELSDSKREVDDRGFAENIDLGWARHGSSESTSATQNRSEKFVCALPHIIHKKHEKEFKQITALLDQMTDFMDRHFLDDGCLLFNDPDRDKQFAGRLRLMHGGEKFRGEAFTIVRQRLGTLENVTKGECNFEPTKRHM